jgi:hypothetical protein
MSDRGFLVTAGAIFGLLLLVAVAGLVAIKAAHQ